MIARRHFDLPRVNLGATTKRILDLSLNVGGRDHWTHFDQIGHRLHAPNALNRPFSRFSLKVPFHRPFECEQTVLHRHCDFAARKMNVAFQKVNGVLCNIGVRALTYHSHQEFIGEAFNAENSLRRLFSRDFLRVVIHGSGKRHYAVLRGHADAVEAVGFLTNTGDPEGGLRYLTASRDRSARLWSILDVSNLSPEEPVRVREVLALRKHDLGVTAIQATADGRTLMTASLDGRVILWPTGD